VTRLGEAKLAAVQRAVRVLREAGVEMPMPTATEGRAVMAAFMGLFDAGREHAARIADEFVDVAAGHSKKDQGQRRMARRIAKLIREEAE
jgi:hypothetical protein